MNKQECISQLEDLKKHCMDWSPEPPWDKDVEALDMAIASLKGTAPEVPVQEQLKVNFNPLTGEKLHETCPSCWVKHKPYNCGYKKCLGKKLLVLEVQDAIHPK